MCSDFLHHLVAFKELQDVVYKDCGKNTIELNISGREHVYKDKAKHHHAFKILVSLPQTTLGYILSAWPFKQVFFLQNFILGKAHFSSRHCLRCSLVALPI